MIDALLIGAGIREPSEGWDDEPMKYRLYYKHEKTGQEHRSEELYDYTDAFVAVRDQQGGFNLAGMDVHVRMEPEPPKPSNP